MNKSSLAKVIRQGEIVPYFQPLIEIRTGSLLGFEVLARWLHPTRGLLGPSHFILMIESSGLIRELTEMIFTRATTAARAWPQSLMLAINLSPLQLQEHELPRSLHRIAEQNGFRFSRLVLEVTESVQIND